MSGTKRTPLFLPRDDRWVRPYFGAYSKELLGAIGLGILTFVCAALLMFFSGYLIARCAERPEQGIFIVLTPVALVQVTGVGKPFVRYVERLVSHDWVFRMTSDLRRRLYGALEALGIGVRGAYRTGDVLGLVADDIGHLQNLYLRTIFPLVIGWILVAVVSVFNGVFDVRFALALLAVLALLAIVAPYAAFIANRKRMARSKTLKDDLYATLTDNVLGATDWVLSGRGADYIDSQKGDEAQLRDTNAAIDCSARVSDLASAVLFAAGAVIVLLWAAGYFGPQVGPDASSWAETTLGRPSNWIAAFVLGFFPLADAFMPLSTAAAQANAHHESIERLNRLDETPRVPSESEGGTVVETSQEGAAVEISFEGVDFAYDGGNPILKDVSLIVPPGQKVAILGKSGSGKTTLGLLLRGELVPDKGHVRLGGSDATQMREGISRVIGVVQQDAYLFNRTLRENLLIGRPDATDEEIVAVLTKVGLKSMFDALPEGLDTMVDEAGRRFSGGQRHRIALARVLLAQVGVVLLDEPTVGLDPATESALLDTFFATTQEKTLIMITHHLQGIERFDRVIFIEDGNIELDGSPADLHKTSERYRMLRSFDLGLSVV